MIELIYIKNINEGCIKLGYTGYIKINTIDYCILNNNLTKIIIEGDSNKTNKYGFFTN